MFIRYALPACRWLPLLAALCLVPAAGVRADDSKDADVSQDKPKDVPKLTTETPVPLDTLDSEATYVGQGAFKIKRFDGTGAGTQQSYDSISETQLSLEYGRRFQLFGATYLRLAASYERFDFSTTNAPIPTSLQSLGGVVAIEYIQQGEIGAFLRLAPAFYYSDIDQISRGNFNVPFSLGTLLPIGKKIFVLVGAEVNVLTKYPVLPLLGVVILFTDHLRLEARPPTPRLIYSYSEALDFFVGGDVVGDSYKRGSNPGYRPQDRRFNGGVIDFSEFRAEGGITYTPFKKLDLDIDFAGGWDFGQNFDYYRGSGKEFKTTGAPYARIALTTKF